jgi:hypothetical protein
LADAPWKKMYIIKFFFLNRALIYPLFFFVKLHADVDKLKFSVYDPHWHEGEEAIKSLNVRYKDIWNVTSE